MQRATEKELQMIRKEKRRIWNTNYKRWIASDPCFDLKYELHWSHIYDGIPGGWYLKKKNDYKYRNY
jgi:hypothetical protein